MQENLHMNNSNNGLIECNINNVEWGGSGIEKTLFDFISSKFVHNSNMVEIGSGYTSTGAFSTIFNVYSIDNDSKYQYIYKKVNYITAPLVDGWYDINILTKKLPEEYSFIFLDGPSGSGNRNEIIKNINLFKNVPIIVHDTYRIDELTLAVKLSMLLDKKIKIYSDNDFWAVIE